MWQNICALLIISTSVFAEYKYNTKWFNVPLDHFSYHRNETFNIKYLVNEEFWDQGGGPIFFYTGNEGQIEQFAKHTGFMWDIASEFKAKLVFAEHRYYGESMPFGNKSLDNEHIGFLSSAQALADYAELINFLQGDVTHSKYPVIAFGGSYGGMLAAYFRMKYPHVVTGAIAASAPIHMYPGMVPCEAYSRIVTSSYKITDPKCVENIRESWNLIKNVSSNPNNTLQKDWKLCDPVKNSSDTNTLLEFLQSVYETIAMVNYPFPSDFLMSLPGQPVRYVCQYLNTTLTGDKLLKAIGQVIQVYANYDGKSKCIDYRNSNYGNLDANGWDYQACTEMVMPMCTTGVDDMFPPSPWNFTDFSKTCHDKYGVYPRPNAAKIEYGGDKIQSASNIVFSNGLLDPWAGGGILNSISESVVAVVIVDGAHHLDLMASNPVDPPTVREARNIHKQNIRKWIRNFRDSKN
ncbi:lysosomal Pro-X carboxypeptidase [Hyposmocoma kahamanoa]|uniref:lysosomal Pro-X carboxypeptidase n=1 Tax=Hyposmocoma kahamanoa TaxID=1477025 RepID=UPI000E6D6788|nr:lysosomal Pro-X carboxypeptidase [Hyposmocoma kahamanoa]